MRKFVRSSWLPQVATALCLALEASAVTFDWVTVGAPGNVCEAQAQGCFGAVAYTYEISKYEVTNAQYTEFLNAVADDDPNSLYDTAMGSGFGGITRAGSAGSFTYSVVTGRSQMPVNFISFYDAIRFANWLHNGQQGSGTTDYGAYTITAAGILANSIARGTGATIVLPSEDEWYKAAYYNAGSTSYFDYPAGSSTATTCAAPGATPNTGNCQYVVADFTDAGSYTGSSSPAGTFDQGGNAYEWNEGHVGVSERSLRGGSFPVPSAAFAAAFRFGTDPSNAGPSVGFRVVRIPSVGELVNPIEVRIPTAFDSGPLDFDIGDLPAVVFETDVQTPDAVWSRAYFSVIELPPGSILRITSLLDGQVQELDRFTAEMWGLASAYFNGDTIRIQIVAAPHTSGNRVALESIGAQLGGSQSECTDGVCDCPTDLRALSNEDWSGRWVEGGCTASVFNVNGGYVSAGHCWTEAPGTELGFRIPLGSPTCDPPFSQPMVADQFPVVATNAVHSQGNCALDWRIGKLGINSQYGQTHYQRYRVFRPVASGPPPVGGAVTLYAFGKTSIPERNGVQQRTSSTVSYVSADRFHATGGKISEGTSGGGWLYNNEIVGINTCCASQGCIAIASRIDQPAYIDARQQMFPHTVHAPFGQPFCATDILTAAPITVCNTSDAGDSYQLDFVGRAPGPGCTVNGPTDFTVAGQNPLSVPNGFCFTVQVLIGRPSGFTAAGNTGCYDVTATSLTTGFAVTERGTVRDRRDLCTTSGPTSGFETGLVTLPLGTPREFEFTIRNDGVPSGVLAYRVEAMGPDMEPSGAIALDGNYVGVASNGVVNIPLGSTGQIAFGVSYRWLQPFDVSDIVVSTDIDGNGEFEPLVSVGVHSVEKIAAVPALSPIGVMAFLVSLAGITVLIRKRRVRRGGENF